MSNRLAAVEWVHEYRVDTCNLLENYLSITLLKKEKLSVNVAFAAELPATSKLCSARTRLLIEAESTILVIDYSHYLEWAARRQAEPEYEDFLRVEDNLTSITTLTLRDEATVKKISDQKIDAIEIRIDQDVFHQFAVKSVLPDGSSTLVFSL